MNTDPRRLRRWILPAFGAAFALFLTRPFFFDDGSVVASARAARASPLRPYDFTLDLETPRQPVWPAGGLPAYTHPPLTAWYLGAVGALAGEREWVFHGAMLLWALLSLLLAERLLALWSSSPAGGLWLLAFSPAFFLTSLTLYPHFIYLTFWLLACCAMEKLLRGGSGAWGAVWGLAAAGAALSLHQWPLLLAANGLRWMVKRNGEPRRPWKSALWGFGVFILIYGLWCWHETRVYGSPQILGSFRLRTGSPAGFPWRAALLPFIFWGGACPALWTAWKPLGQKNKKTCAVLALLGVLFFSLLWSPWGGFSVGTSLLAAFFLSSSGAALLWLGLQRSWKNPEDRFLLLWLLMELAFAVKYLTFPCGHHLLPLTFLTILVLSRTGAGRPFPRWTAGTAFALTLTLAWADQSQARVGPRLAEDLQPWRTARSFYWGNDFGPVEFYLKKAGWSALDKNSAPRPGDRIVILDAMNAQGPWTFLRAYPLRVLQRFQYDSPLPLRTWSIPAGAGWYSASWGPLPYAPARGPLETVTLLEYPGGAAASQIEKQ